MSDQQDELSLNKISIALFKDNGNLYVIELSHNIYENYKENESENKLNNNIQQEEIQNKRIRDTSKDCGRSCKYNHNCDHNHSYSYDQNNESETQQLVQLFLSFNLFHHSRPLHKFTLNLPNEHQIFSLSPYLIFSLFFSFEQINTIVQNTNKYAYLKSAGEKYKWEKLTISEFEIWLAILIYASIFKLPSI
ncbi:hypothetical protein Glove_174g32 [Diversispora epigaea]|uniref:PiggyBac transposable element-derived protein domain-containing protein n=1 Tax=Diversispora epigaea TaxID=1348612 RepID=A0A397IX33_9GLOM|nr:hypothetical protein Glove_174g32 [Diversispora epigaea]